ncbi:50S ribosomal protein L31e [Candidatus Gugararchaeum adminiculabundum]|nr:50S ribosomal protein L31e [Candidatus Gugararchaeum adminiculabundum]
MAETERVYTIPLAKTYEKHARNRRALYAVKFVRAFLARHMKVALDEVKISTAVNHAIFARGIKAPPRRIKLMASKDKVGMVLAQLLEEKEPKKEDKKKEAKKEKPKAAPAKEEKKEKKSTAPEKA